MTNEEDYGDVDVQIFARLRGYESLMDIVFDTAAVKAGFEHSSGGGVGFSALCTLGVLQISNKERMEKVMRTVTLLLQHSAGSVEEVNVFVANAQRVESLVKFETNRLIEATGIRGETDRYERAVKVWRNGARELVTKAKHQVKAEVERLEKGVEQMALSALSYGDSSRSSDSSD